MQNPVRTTGFVNPLVIHSLACVRTITLETYVKVHPVFCSQFSKAMSQKDFCHRSFVCHCICLHGSVFWLFWELHHQKEWNCAHQKQQLPEQPEMHLDYQRTWEQIPSSKLWSLWARRRMLRLHHYQWRYFERIPVQLQDKDLPYFFWPKKNVRIKRIFL